MATRLAAGRHEVRNPIGSDNFSLLQNVNMGTGTHPASYSMHTRVLHQWQSGEPSTADIKKAWSYTSTSTNALMAWIGTTSPFIFTEKV